MMQVSEKEASDCNIIGPLGLAADSSVLQREKAALWISARPVRLYTATVLVVLAPTILL